MSTRWHFVIQGSMSLDSNIIVLNTVEQTEADKSRKGFAFPELFKQSLLLSKVVKKSKNILVCMIKSPMIEATVHSYASLLNVL